MRDEAIFGGFQVINSYGLGYIYLVKSWVVSIQIELVSRLVDRKSPATVMALILCRVWLLPHECEEMFFFTNLRLMNLQGRSLFIDFFYVFCINLMFIFLRNHYYFWGVEAPFHIYILKYFKIYQKNSFILIIGRCCIMTI